VHAALELAVKGYWLS